MKKLVENNRAIKATLNLGAEIVSGIIRKDATTKEGHPFNFANLSFRDRKVPSTHQASCKMLLTYTLLDNYYPERA